MFRSAAMAARMSRASWTRTVHSYGAKRCRSTARAGGGRTYRVTSWRLQSDQAETHRRKDQVIEDSVSSLIGYGPDTMAELCHKTNTDARDVRGGQPIGRRATAGGLAKEPRAARKRKPGVFMDARVILSPQLSLLLSTCPPNAPPCCWEGVLIDILRFLPPIETGGTRGDRGDSGA